MKKYTFLVLTLMLSSTVYGEEPFKEDALLFPLESWHNHGSSIVECPDGSFLACWFHGSGERTANDVRIEGARKPAGSLQWSERFVMADTPEYPDCNPVLFIDAKKRLWLFWITVLSNQWESSLLKYRTSTNFLQNGPPQWDWQDVIHITPPDTFADEMMAVWGPSANAHPELIAEVKKDSPLPLETREDVDRYMKKQVSDKLLQRLGWMTRIHPMELASGKILLPLYTDAFSVGLIAVTEDEGKTWKASHPIIGYGNIQPSLVQKKDGTIVAFMRENGPRNKIRFSSSKDEGFTWSPVTETGLLNPGSSVEAVCLKNGHWMLIYNDLTEGRHQLAVSLSDDEGASWKWTRHLEKEKPGNGSFSYPSILQSKDGYIHATYSYFPSDKMKSIKYVKFNEAWILAGDKE